MFSVVNAFVFRPLPIADPDRVVFVQRVGSFVSHAFPAYRDFRDRNVAFDGLAGFRITMMEFDADGHATHEWGYLVTGNYFDLLGVRPALGRLFHQGDDQSPGASPYVVLSHHYWLTRFSGRASAIGSTVRINRLPYTVLGVAPPDFHGTEIFYRPSMWVPMSMQAQIEVGNPWLENRNTSNTWIVGRLKPGVSIGEAESNLNTISTRLAAEYPTHGDDARIKLTKPGLVGDAIGAPARAFAIGVMFLAVLVLVTACVNLASTLAARGADRQREVAVRLSIGAARGRIVRQLLTESIVLALLGGIAGAGSAFVAARALSLWQLPIALPIQIDITPDARVFAFSFAATLLAAVAFGVAPASQAVKTDLSACMKTIDGPRAGRWPIRDLFVGAQVMLCFVLVAASLMALRGLERALALPLGMDGSGVTMAAFDLGPGGYSDEAGENLRRRALDRIAALPGIEEAAYGNSLPLNIDQSSTVVFPDDRPELQRSEAPRAIQYQVSPGFFRTLGIRLLQGRDIDWRDTPVTRRVAVVNQAFARTILRSDDVVGRHFRTGPQGPAIEVVGVVAMGKYQSLTEAETPAMFASMAQSYNTTTVMLVKSSLPTSQVARQIEGVVAAVDRSLPLFGVRSIDEMLGFVLLPMRVAAVALSAFGILAVMLAATGIYGVVSYAVARRRREIAIRVAVGATRGGILQIVLRRIAILIAAGCALGVPLALAMNGVLRNVVYQTSGNDVISLSAVTVIVALVAAFACWVPARRALGVDPCTALHIE